MVVVVVVMMILMVCGDVFVVVIRIHSNLATLSIIFYRTKFLSDDWMEEHDFIELNIHDENSKLW